MARKPVVPVDFFRRMPTGGGTAYRNSYSCPYCPAVFLHQAALDAHIQDQHGDTPSDDE